ncbi:TRAF3-interacting JNK-activating modulator [Salarias fasciatus]|uniref:TRAF3 interacting protein 3 n=1 Tax=Salarias fasciatus TaxID=181472 RepID=A0A672F5R4_SALFA|nr:TRAF3-interacting JNK-activating modulator [Salarias fasciatus]
MDGAPQPSPAKHFEQLSDIRAEKRQHLRGRNNQTSCRSPTRELDTTEIKNKLKEKRHEEFLRRRSVSPEPRPTGCSSERKPSGGTMRHRGSSSQSETLHTNTPKRPAANGHPRMILTPSSSETVEAPGTSKQDPPGSEQIAVTVHEKPRERKQASTSAADEQEWSQHRVKGRPKKQRSQKVNIQTEMIFQSPSVQSQVTIEKKILENSSMRTEPGFVLVRESDIERLANYLEEALWREDSLKKKLAALQQSTSLLMSSSDAVWTSRFTEDLLRSKIKALEAQLHVCLQKFPPEGMEALAVQKEKQRVEYEGKALEALQRATREKAQALSRAETLQEAVQRETAEARRWQSLYEELKQSQNVTHQQLQQQLHGQAELSRVRQDELQQEVASLRQEKRELQYNMCLLEEDNQTLREEIQQLRDVSDESQDLFMQEYLLSEQAEPRLSVRRDAGLEEQLRQSEEKLQLRQRECEELQTELDVVKQECQSSQVRLSQCREELRKLSHRRRTGTPCGSRWSVCVVLWLLLAVAGVAMLYLCHPPFREQAADLYADVWTRIEGYLVEAASSPHSRCVRPI